ncbi:MAG: hypothetical protein KGL39_56005 [Patescibacteria group bacterium]|nr:hypothetical protein [Patescibacteria group bacterium]
MTTWIISIYVFMVAVVAVAFPDGARKIDPFIAALVWPITITAALLRRICGWN